MPPIVTIQPKSVQIFRVSKLKATPELLEKAYRVVLEDVSEDNAKRPDSGISFKFNHSLPLFYFPTAPTYSLGWSACESLVTGKKCLRLENKGNVHFKFLWIESVTNLKTENISSANTILAGGFKEFLYLANHGSEVVDTELKQSHNWPSFKSFACFLGTNNKDSSQVLDYNTCNSFVSCSAEAFKLLPLDSMLKMNKLYLKIAAGIAVSALILSVSYFSYLEYGRKVFLANASPIVKNTSLRINAVNKDLLEGRGLTYSELFSKLEGGIEAIEKGTIEIQTLSTQRDKVESEKVTAYLEATQSYFRSVLSHRRKLLEFRSTTTLATNYLQEMSDSIGGYSYKFNESRAKNSIDEMRKLETELKETRIKVVDSILKQQKSAEPMVAIFSKDVYIPSSGLAELNEIYKTDLRSNSPEKTDK